MQPVECTSSGYIIKRDYVNGECKINVIHNGQSIRNVRNIFQAKCMSPQQYEIIEREFTFVVAGHVGDVIDVGIVPKHGFLRAGGNTTSSEDYKESQYAHFCSKSRRPSKPAKPEEITTSRELNYTIASTLSARRLALCIYELNSKKDKTPHEQDIHDDFVHFALINMTSSYKDVEVVKTEEVHKEFAELVLSNNKEIVQKVFAEFLEYFDKSAQINDHAFHKALQYALRAANPEHMDANQLLPLLALVRTKLARFHYQRETEPDLLVNLETLTDLLTALSDAGIKNISYDETHDPLYKQIEAIRANASSIFIAAQADAALEALKSIKHNRGKLDLAMHRLAALAKGINYITYAVGNNYYISFEDAFKQFKIAWHSHAGKKEWFDYFRYLDFLIQGRSWTNFDLELTAVIKNVLENHKKDYPHFLAMLAKSLNHVISNPLARTEDRLRALEEVISLYEDNAKWSLTAGIQEKFKMQVELMKEFKEWASSANVSVRTRARLQIITCQTRAKAGSLEEQCLIEAGVKDLDVNKLPFDDPKDLRTDLKERTHPLFTHAKGKRIGIDAKLRELATTQTDPSKTSHVKQFVSGHYIARTAVKMDYSNSTNKSEEVVSLETIFFDFQNQDQYDTALLEGPVASGKSTEIEYLEYKGWGNMKTHPKQQPVLVKLNLLAAKRDPVRALDKELLKKFDKEQLPEIKKRPIVVFCDEYHRLPKGMNLYSLLKRECPKIKIFAVGVHESLPRVEEDELFCALAPLNDGRPQKDRFLHLKFQPVTEASLIADVDHYLKTKSNPLENWKTGSDYMNNAAKVPGFKELLKKPVYIKFFREEFPALFEAHKKIHGEQAMELFELDIVEHLVFKTHFPREQVKLTEQITHAASHDERTRLAEKSVNFIVKLEDFQNKFASYLKSKELVAVDKSELEDPACSAELKWFFSPEQDVYLQASLIVERDGEWRFEHDLYLELFSHRDIVAGLKKETIDGRPLKHKNYSELDLSLEGIGLLAIAMKRDHHLLEILKKITTLTTKAGDNSKKALAQYEAKFCRKAAVVEKPDEKDEIWV